MPAIHNVQAIPLRPVTIRISVPITQVPATTVKKPGPLVWLVRSSITLGK